MNCPKGKYAYTYQKGMLTVTDCLTLEEYNKVISNKNLSNVIQQSSSTLNSPTNTVTGSDIGTRGNTNLSTIGPNNKLVEVAFLESKQKKDTIARNKTTIGTDTRSIEEKQKDAQLTEQINNRREGLGFIEGTGHTQQAIDRDREKAEQIFHNLVDIPSTLVGIGELAAIAGKGAVKIGNAAINASPEISYGLNNTVNKGIGILQKIDDKIIYPIQYRSKIKELENLLTLTEEQLRRPEAIERMRMMGIDPEYILSSSPKITSTPLKETSYSPRRDQININFRDTKGIDTREAIEHEYGHRIQNAAKSSTGERETVIDKNAQFIVTKDPSNLKEYHTISYFKTPDDYNRHLEGMPYLREMRQDMLQRGILKDQYQRIDENILSNYLNSESGQRFKQVIDKNSASNYRVITDLLNRLPSITTGAVGVGVANNIINEKRKGGSMYSNLPKAQLGILKYSLPILPMNNPIYKAMQSGFQSGLNQVSNFGSSLFDYFTGSDNNTDNNTDNNIKNIKDFENLYNERRINVDNTLFRNSTIPETGRKIMLTSGRFNTANVPTGVIDMIIEASKRQGIPVGKPLTLIGRESTFGVGTEKNRERSSSQKNLASSWNSAGDLGYQPYNYLRFLADKNVPGILTTKNRQGWSFKVQDENLLNDYLKTHPDMFSQYQKILDTKTKPVGDLTNFDIAIQKLMRDGVEKYNPNDKKYKEDFYKDYELLKRDVNLQKYLKEKGVVFLRGGLIRRADGSYSRRGLWDNIRANRGSGKEPTKQMLEQERKIRKNN